MDPLQEEFFMMDNQFLNRQPIVPFWFWWLMPSPWQPGPWQPRPPWHPGPPGPRPPWQGPPGPRPPRW